MVYAVDFRDGTVLEWSLTDDGATATEVTDYAPTVHVVADDRGDLGELRETLATDPAVVDLATESWRRGFRHGPEPTLRVAVATIDDVRPVAHRIRDRGPPGAYRPFDVDFTREFRYCLERGIDPVPNRDLRTLAIEVPRTELADPPPTEATVREGVDGGSGGADPDDGDETFAGDAREVVAGVYRRIDDADPDVLVVDAADVLPAFHEAAAEFGVDGHLGRRHGLKRLAGESTFESYGQVRHSPARYDVPGRVVIDRSNTFLYRETNLDGCLDLVRRSRKPLQELAWASIGNVLTAIQIREARSRGVLVPWNSWRHEFFKPAATLHEADRGGFTFAPDVGVHEGVHELDFSSLYPNIIRTRNVSPETIRCDCHADREDVPGLDYAICDEAGYLPEVLRPLIDDRDAIKAELRDCGDPERRAELEGQSDAIKWILVSCFGYQGFNNAKFGRIECHEAINAFAREILLDAKERLEAGGWRVVHGIVDSLWVTPREGDDQDPLDELAAAITEAQDVRLEYEAEYDWIAFVPQRSSDAGALTKYFGKRVDGGYKYRGIECRQRSTPAFVADAQRDLVATYDRTRRPEAVCDRLQRHLDRLRGGDVDPTDLLVRQRTSKPLEAYSASTRGVAALERAAADGHGAGAGRDVEFVVVDDGKDSRDRVRLAHEDVDDYDRDFYATELLRAAESVLSPMGWREDRIERYLADTRDATLALFD